MVLNTNFITEMMLVLKCIAYFLVTRKKEHESHEPWDTEAAWPNTVLNQERDQG